MPLPPTLREVAEEWGRDAATTAMLAGINVAGRYPTTREGWLLVWLAIRHACGLGSGTVRPRVASRPDSGA